METYLNCSILNAWVQAGTIQDALRTVPDDPPEKFISLARDNLGELIAHLKLIVVCQSGTSVSSLVTDAWNCIHTAEWGLVRYGVQHMPVSSPYWHTLRVLMTLKHDLFAALCAAHLWREREK